MAAVNPVKLGFRPIGGDRIEPRPYSVASGYSPSNSHPGIAPGEVVKLVTAGTVQVADAGDTTLLGVVAAVKYRDTAGNIVSGSYIAAGYTFSGQPAAKINPLAPVIYVWDQPNMEYIANVATTTTLATFVAGVGANMDLNATSSTGVDTVFARSKRQLDGTFVAGTANFRILELIREPAQDFTVANIRVRCMINEGSHVLMSGAGI
jgi:hypothetical protein